MGINGRYVKIATKFWADEKVVDLDPETKLLYLYILSCPHSNMAGYYRLPKPYIQADLKLSDKGLTKGFNKLLSKGLIKYCEKSSVILIPNYYKYNSIQNENQAKGAANRTSELPKNSLVKDYKKAVKHYAESYQKELCKGLPKGFNKGLPKQSGNTELELDTELELEIDTDTENCPAEKKQDDTSKIPYKEIVQYLNNRTGSQYKSTTKKTQKLIKARWNEGFRLTDFKDVIDKKTTEWIDDSKMSKYLRPPTLFSNKFESYLNQLSVSNDNKSKENQKNDIMRELYQEYEQEEKINGE